MYGDHRLAVVVKATALLYGDYSLAVVVRYRTLLYGDHRLAVVVIATALFSCILIIASL